MYILILIVGIFFLIFLIFFFRRETRNKKNEILNLQRLLLKEQELQELLLKELRPVEELPYSYGCGGSCQTVVEWGRCDCIAYSTFWGGEITIHPKDGFWITILPRKKQLLVELLFSNNIDLPNVEGITCGSFNGPFAKAWSWYRKG
jgi:hypothetical protein